ncbi:uroporphyrinogen decarboxylase [Nisaea acidiphila]|uniref:Uroporphyrinogen decarboxylase n=1 Tax=Nisaea acidiphila TaxID=1862145 RepID=A0A9J7AY37_9PROT|nr:uroporphyrinogen decarboxylase [Nisaea acidiphila]UUX52192.1 uroporphyrinogen decarboxylase [Nisaea acidiphila]
MTEKPILKALAGQVSDIPPIWLMRQAGRYLPEYREVRKQAGSFVDLCLNPEMAAEVTLQPIRRFGMDGAILFSDILIVPYGLGQPLKFVEGRGPVLDPVKDRQALSRLDLAGLTKRVGNVYETVSRVREALPAETTLIGFSGSPWTVITYMVEGGSSKDYAATKQWAYSDPEGFQALIDIVVEGTITYLLGQAKAGAEVLKLFDSWAGVLSPRLFRMAVLEPTKRIVSAVKSAYPDLPVIGFPRAAGANYLDYIAETGVDAVAVDTAMPIRWAVENIQSKMPIQGNLDPIALLAGGAGLEQEVKSILDVAAAGPFIFNLGHGILPTTPIEHVEQLLRHVRGK